MQGGLGSDEKTRFSRRVEKETPAQEGKIREPTVIQRTLGRGEGAACSRSFLLKEGKSQKRKKDGNAEENRQKQAPTPASKKNRERKEGGR